MNRAAQLEPAASHKNRPFLIGWLMLLIGSILVYWPLSKAEFINYDDMDYVFQNLPVQKGLSLKGFIWAFTGSKSANWHPLTWLSHMLDSQLFGIKPGWHHLTNLALHTVNTLLLFGLFRRMTKALWRSFFVAALFAFHPLHVESVAWISERKDLLSGLFFILTLWAYLRYVEQSKVQGPKAKVRLIWYSFALFLFACGLMSKPMLVTVPFVLLLLDYWPLQRFAFNQRAVAKAIPGSSLNTLPFLLVEKVPFFFLSLCSSVVTFLVQRAAGAVSRLEALPVAERLGNALVAYSRYLFKTVWPANLAVYYPHPGSWAVWKVILAAALLIALTLIVLSQLRQRRFLATGWFWFLGMLVPVIGIVQVGSQSMADRYMYLPAIGLFFILAWAGAALFDKTSKPALFSSMAMAVSLTTCAFLARLQASYWKDSEALFRHALAVTGDNYMAEFCLGNALIDKQKDEEGRQHLEAAARLNPAFATVHGALATLVAKQGQFEQAIAYYHEALRRQPNSPEALNNLAWLLATCPEEKLRNGAQAVLLAQRACELTQYQTTVYIGTLAAAYAEAGRFAEAVATAQRACEVATTWGEDHLVQRNKELLQLYAAKRPFHEGPQ